jgi:hypothetical protein
MRCPRSISWQLIGSIPLLVEYTFLLRQSSCTLLYVYVEVPMVWSFDTLCHLMVCLKNEVSHDVCCIRYFTYFFNMEHYGDVLYRFLFTVCCSDLWCMKCIYIHELWCCMQCMCVFDFWSVRCICLWGVICEKCLYLWLATCELYLYLCMRLYAPGFRSMPNGSVIFLLTLCSSYRQWTSISF